MLRRLAYAPLLMAGMLLAPTAILAQSSPVADLRLVDDAGIEIPLESSSDGEQIYRLADGIEGLNIAFDFSGTSATFVQLRIMGNRGSILYQETESYEAPGSFTVPYEHGSPLEVGEYVVNVYVGDDVYLADSFQLAVGEEVVIAGARGEGAGEVMISTPEVPLPAPTLETPDTGGDAPGASPLLLILAGIGMVLLFGIVLWAGWSAMRRS